MLFRKIEKPLREALGTSYGKIPVVEGARQIGKSFIIRKVGTELYPNFLEINLLEDKEGLRLFERVTTPEDFYLQLSMIGGEKLGKFEDTLVFLDEIQVYAHLLTMLKFLRQQGRYHYVASGSLLGLSLHQSVSVPIGSVEIFKMYPLDFEEFLIANGAGTDAIAAVKTAFRKRESLNESLAGSLMNFFRKYLLSGGMPDAVNTYLDTRNIVEVRRVQTDIHHLYEIGASQYDRDHRLKIERIYRMIPSQMENKKKRIIIRDIEERNGKRFTDYKDEFDYLVDSGIALEVKAVTGPRFPLIESGTRNLLKLYLNDVGILTGILYRNNIRAILDDEKSVNLGAVYESVIAQELIAHGYSPYYYDNKKNGEVDYLIDDYTSMSVLPIEVKSGKDYSVHSALTRFVDNPDYNVKEAIVLCNSPYVRREGKITYMPVYYVMGMEADAPVEGDIFF